MNAAFQISLNIMQHALRRKYSRSLKLFALTDFFAFTGERRHLHHQRGRFGIAHNTARMAWAYKNTERENVGINCQ
jgi:hypothetical protein